MHANQNAKTVRKSSWLAIRLLMRIAAPSARLLCYRTKPTLRLMRSNAVTSGVGNARLSGLEPMLRRAALGKLPLVSTPFANLTINETPETIAKLMLVAQQKLPQVHCFTCLPLSSPVDTEDEKLSNCDSRLLSRVLHKFIVFTLLSGCRSS